MYTILVNDSNELVTTVKERILQRSKLVDNLHFLVDPTYKNIDMSDFTVTIEYVLPVSREYKTETLVKSKDLYKDKLEYILPFDTNLTKEAGKIRIQLTFTRVYHDDNGKIKQQVRKAGPATIAIEPVEAWSDMIPDSALSALDQRLIRVDAMINAANEMNQRLLDNKADDIAYNEDTSELQLLANGSGIGRKITIKTGVAELEDGVPVVDLDDTHEDEGATGGDIIVEDDDDVVEF
jgi:hypothetical protein